MAEQSDKATCLRCGGAGILAKVPNHPQLDEECPVCHGTGKASSRGWGPRDASN